MVDFTWNSPSSHVSTFNLSFLSSTINICPSTGPVQHTPAKGAHDKAGKDDEKNTRIWFCWAHVVLCVCLHSVATVTIVITLWTCQPWKQELCQIFIGLWRFRKWTLELYEVDFERGVDAYRHVSLSGLSYCFHSF